MVDPLQSVVALSLLATDADLLSVKAMDTDLFLNSLGNEGMEVLLPEHTNQWIPY